MDYIILRDDSYSIEHHGIKGQKWGVRRYQNEDGSLTEAGRQRYSSNDSIREYGKTTTKSRALLSDNELDDRIKRLEKEKRLKDLEKEVLSTQTAGQKFAKTTLGQVGKKVATTFLTGSLLYFGSKAIPKMIDNLNGSVDLANSFLSDDQKISAMELVESFDPKGLESALFNGGPKKNK